MTSEALIGFDARKIRDFGIGTYIRQLLEAMARRPESEAYRFRVYLSRRIGSSSPASRRGSRRSPRNRPATRSPR